MKDDKYSLCKGVCICAVHVTRNQDLSTEVCVRLPPNQTNHHANCSSLFSRTSSFFIWLYEVHLVWPLITFLWENQHFSYRYKFFIGCVLRMFEILFIVGLAPFKIFPRRVTVFFYSLIIIWISWMSWQYYPRKCTGTRVTTPTDPPTFWHGALCSHVTKCEWVVRWSWPVSHSNALLRNMLNKND